MPGTLADEEEHDAVDVAVPGRGRRSRLEKRRQREAERRDRPGVQEIAAAVAVAKCRGPVGIEADHERAPGSG
jgi:hypothetical protein